MTLGTWLRRVRRPRVLRPASGFLISFLIHTGALITLGLWILAGEAPRRLTLIMVPAEEAEEAEPLEAPPAVVDLGPQEVADTVAETTQWLQTPDAPQVPATVAGLPVPQPVVPARPADWRLDSRLLLTPIPEAAGGGLEGRTQEARARLLAARGGTPQSEDAVAKALQWLAAHQRPDGGWRFDHQEGPCDGRCPHPGTIGTTTGATGLALLPFLGAGQTTREGMHRETVQRGLYYLMGRILDTRHGADLQEGTMYAQGIATLALCEAYAMTGEEELGRAAQKAVDFICSAQHPAGGWRYVPGAPGDTTVFGWQMMALKSARLARLEVPSPVIERAKAYLDSVQSEEGACYGYLKPAKEPSPTAIGLLSRMYTGWGHRDPRLVQGVEYLAALGPSRTDVYFDYYATQVLNHFDGPEWERWNLRMREHLIKTQSREGHAAGSWYFSDRHGTIGGRLYTTAMCAMILEVYYRYMPLYGDTSIEDTF